MRKDILVLVHPGSACGSADFNLGKYDARAARDGLVLDLDGWQGGIVVIDSDLSDELDNYPVFSDAIKKAVEEARLRGDLAVRIVGSDESDYNQVSASEEMIETNILQANKHNIFLTGTWFDPNGEFGCVNSVNEVFEKAGFSITISDNAVSLDADSELENDEDVNLMPNNL